MTDVKKCPQCGVELPADAPAGICPKCLLAVGMVSDTAVRGESSDGAPTTPLPGSTRFVPPTPAALAHLFPQLEILEMIGVGGMGAVYKARQPGLDRLVAVKILPPEVGADPAFAQRFTREAQALARLGHQHIVPVYDFGVAQGLYYFIMEYVDGANLRHLIKTGEMKPADALAIVPQICEALQFAHEEGVVHRDIKPENILIDKRGRVKIADFGLARLLGTAAPELSLTGTNQVLGTLHYMAPEQIQGLRTVDHRADIYSLGVVFYEMLTGELPLGRFAPPSQKIGVDVRLDEVVLRSLESKPERRYQHASEVKTDVETISRESSAADHRQASARPVTAKSSAIEVAGLEASGSHVAAVRKPAVALMIAAGLGFFGNMLLVFPGFIWLMYSARNVRPNGSLLMLVFCYVLVVVVATLLTVAGALSMRNRRHYWLAITACILTILPLSIAWPVGLPIGLWALVVLTAPEVRAAFARNATPSLKSPRERLHWPAIALIVTGLLDLAEALLCCACIILFFAVMPPGGKTPEGHQVVFGGLTPAPAIIFGVPALVLGLLRLVGGIRMRRLQSHGFTSLAAVSSLLPVTLGSFVGVPASIWALIVLSQSDVKAAFALAKSRQRDEDAVERRSEAEPIPHDTSATFAATHQHEGRRNSSDLSAKTVGDAEEYQRAAELAERPPGWLAFTEMGIFGLGWLLAGALWNLSIAGVYLAFAFLAVLTWSCIRWSLIWMPKLRSELSRQSHFRRAFSVVAALLTFGLGFVFVATAAISQWGWFGHAPSQVPSYGEEREQLISAIKNAKFADLDEKTFNVVAPGPFTHRPWWEPMLLALIGYCIVASAVAIYVDTRRYRNGWKFCWRPALKVATLLFTMLLVILVIIVPKSTGVVASRLIRSAAGREQLQSAIEHWAVRNGYQVNARSEGFSSGIQIARFVLSIRSPLDLYRTSWQGVYRPRPPLTIFCGTKTAKRREDVDGKAGPEQKTSDAFVRIDPPWEWHDTPELTLWTPIVDELETEIRAAGKTNEGQTSAKSAQ